MKIALLALTLVSLLAVSTNAFAGESCCNAKDKARGDAPTTQPSEPKK